MNVVSTDPPSRPGKPRIVDYDFNRADISWTASEKDGGNPIQKYVIELLCLPDSNWQTVLLAVSITTNFYPKCLLKSQRFTTFNNVAACIYVNIFLNFYPLLKCKKHITGIKSA